MSDDIVKLDIDDDGIAWVTLNRPDVHNAFDDHMIAALTGSWERLGTMDDVTAVVLRGEGKSFSAGADFNWMKRAAGYSEAQNRDDALKLAQMLHKLYTLPKLTVACVHGAAMGGGMGLVCCCDIVIAEESAKFALSEVKIGLIPATIAPYVLRAMGERHCRRFFQTGERITALQTHASGGGLAPGLVHELCKEGEMNDRLADILNGIKSNGPAAMAAAKDLCLDLADAPLTHDVLEDTAARIAATRAGDEAKEGLNAFLEKRKAGWVKQG